MHPRIPQGPRRLSGCSGGSCPGVYDELAHLPEYLLIRGDNPAGRPVIIPPDRAPHELDLLIRRDLVVDALRPAPVPITPAELQAEFEMFSHSARRIERHQVYAGTARDEQWIALLKASRRWGQGKVHKRIHFVTDPLTPAMQQELTEGYEGNVDAGENIRIYPVAEGDWPDEAPQADFWLFDLTRLIEMHYDPAGAWTGATRITDPEQILAACRTWDAAWHRAVPWRAYVASRADLSRRMAQ